MLKEKLQFVLINTLLLHIPLLALTNGQTDRETNTVAVHGLVNFFCSCAVVSVFGSVGKYVLVLHTYVLRVPYSCDVMWFFWFWWEIVFGVMYVLSVQYSCAVVSVFWLWREIVLKMQLLVDCCFFRHCCCHRCHCRCCCRCCSCHHHHRRHHFCHHCYHRCRYRDIKTVAAAILAVFSTAAFS
jgi:hypothetical protein